MTLTEAKNLTSGDTIHDNNGAYGFNADGTPRRFKITSVKTWKTRPDEIRIGLKWGMYEYLSIDESQIAGFSEGYGS